ncbi:hypothetical protein V8C43DRAFT_273541 [Trichoderma afarasin]
MAVGMYGHAYQVVLGLVGTLQWGQCTRRPAFYYPAGLKRDERQPLLTFPSVAVPCFETNGNSAHPIEAARQTLNIPTQHPHFTRPCAAIPLIVIKYEYVQSTQYHGFDAIAY